MMCPGLTSPGGSLPPAALALEKGTPVAIFAEGKQAPVGMGTLEMGTEEIKKVKCVALSGCSPSVALTQAGRREGRNAPLARPRLLSVSLG
jgi:hypothetical protein